MVHDARSDRQAHSAQSGRESPLQLAAFVCAYLLAAKLGQLLTLAPELGVSLWPPSGLFVVALIRRPLSRWPLWLVCAAIADIAASLWFFQFSLVTALLIACANALEAIVGATILQRRFDSTFSLVGLGPTLSLIAFAALTAPCVSATLGAAAISTELGQSYLTSWWLWWVGDATGVLLLAPLVLAFTERHVVQGVRAAKLRWLEAAVLALVVAGATHIVFSGSYPLPYILMPLLLWAALRFEVVGAALAALVMAVLATWHTALGDGPFAMSGQSAGGRQALVQMFVVITAMVGLTLGAMMRQRREANAHLELAVRTAEAQAAQRSAQLADSEATFRAIYEHSGTGILLAEIDGRVLRGNLAVTRMLGRPTAALIGRALDDWLVEADRPLLRLELDRLALCGASVGEIEVRCQHDDARCVWLSICVSLVPGSELKPPQVVLLLTDMTERKSIEQALHDANRRRSEFLATLAHELRNPLAPIRNVLALKRAGAAKPSQPGWAEGVIERQVVQMARLIDDLTEVSRIDQGKMELRRELVDLAAIVRNALEMSAPTIDAKRHRLQLSLGAEPLRVWGDSARLTQVVVNLLNNAAKYTPAGGRIDVTLEQRGDTASLAVRDTGIGLAADKLHAIFEMFAQIDEARVHSEGGLGIGLYVAKRVIELHSGSIVARSPGSGEGAEFVVSLPVSTQSAASDVEPMRNDG